MIRSARHGGFDFRDIRALVVDDEMFSRNLVRQALLNVGIGEVDTATDGMDAIATLENATQSYDCIITDYRMPRMQGLELLKKIRGGIPGVARDTVIGMLTSHSETEIVGLAFNLDVDFFVLKPPKVNRLRSRLNQAFLTNRMVKPPLNYDPIPTEPGMAADAPEVHPILKQLDADDAGPKAAKRAKRPVVVQSVESVPAGSVLGKDVVTAGGTHILGTGHTLTPQLIDRLKDLAEFDESVRRISVEVPERPEK